MRRMRIAARRTGGWAGWAVFVVLIVAAMWSGGTMLSAAAPDAPVPSPVVAAAASIAVLNVDIWPEHDDPRVLFIYRGQLSAGAPLPYTLTFAIPPSGQVNAAAYRSSNGALLSTDYQYRQDGDRLQVTFTVPERAFQFEYYADLIKGRPQRSLAADVVFPLPVDTMRVSVEQPLRATAFVLTPRADGTTTTPAGFTHHLYTVARWPAGRVWSVRVAYQKADETPSLPRAVAGPLGPQAAPPGVGMTAWAWAAIGVAALGVMSLAAFWLLGRRERDQRDGRGPAAQAVARRGAEAKRAGTSKVGEAAKPAGVAKDAGAARDARGSDPSVPVYCTNCGRRAQPGDRFCARCGRALPRE